MCAATWAHGFDLQCPVTQGKLAAGLLLNQVAAFGNQLLVATPGHISDLCGRCCLLAESHGSGSRGSPCAPCVRYTAAQSHWDCTASPKSLTGARTIRAYLMITFSRLPVPAIVNGH